MATLNLNNIQKKYGKSTVIENISFDIKAGEFIVIVGPSGCGKSTLLRMVAGLESITSGEMYINKKMVNQLEPKDRNIAMVFQNYALYPHMTAYENIAYGLKIQGLSKEAIKQAVSHAASILELDALLERKPSELSGGQRQRIAMGRAIVRNPAIFLFDEPLSNLDAKLRVQMRLEIKRLHQRLNISSLYVTHDQIEAMTLATRIIVMNKGHIEQIGTPVEIYEDPQTRFVANFIGSPAMNFVQAVCINEQQLVLCNSHDSNLVCNTHPFSIPKHAIKPDQGIELGMRPEHIVVLAKDAVSKQDANAKIDQIYFSGTIIMIEQLGADTLLHVDINQKKLIIIRLSRDYDYSVNQKIKVSCAYPHLYLFDTTTGKRILRK